MKPAASGRWNPPDPAKGLAAPCPWLIESIREPAVLMNFDSFLANFSLATLSSWPAVPGVTWSAGRKLADGECKSIPATGKSSKQTMGGWVGGSGATA